MKKSRNWLVALVLVAGSAYLALQQPKQATQNPPATETNAEVTSATEMCAFVWANHDAPELTESLNTQVQALDKNASAYVRFFGEDCVYSDGRSTFGAMETDFYVSLQTDDLIQFEEFGNWISQTAPLIMNMPKESIQGRYGFVEYTFEKSGTEKITIRVPLESYETDSQGKSGAELFDLYYQE